MELLQTSDDAISTREVVSMFAHRGCDASGICRVIRDLVRAEIVLRLECNIFGLGVERFVAIAANNILALSDLSPEFPFELVVATPVHHT
jgi:hypothetical protein